MLLVVKYILEAHCAEHRATPAAWASTCHHHTSKGPDLYFLGSVWVHFRMFGLSESAQRVADEIMFLKIHLCLLSRVCDRMQVDADISRVFSDFDTLPDTGSGEY